MPYVTRQARITKLVSKQDTGHIAGFWISGMTSITPEVGYSICVNPVKDAITPDKYKGTFDFFVTDPAQKMIRTSWGFLFRCRDGMWSLKWE